MPAHSCDVPADPNVLLWRCSECLDVWEHVVGRIAPDGATPWHWRRLPPAEYLGWIEIPARRFLGGVGQIITLRAHERGWPHIRFEVSRPSDASAAAGGVCDADELREAIAPWLRGAL